MFHMYLELLLSSQMYTSYILKKLKSSVATLSLLQLYTYGD